MKKILWITALTAIAFCAAPFQSFCQTTVKPTKNKLPWFGVILGWGSDLDLEHHYQIGGVLEYKLGSFSLGPKMSYQYTFVRNQNDYVLHRLRLSAAGRARFGSVIFFEPELNLTFGKFVHEDQYGYISVDTNPLVAVTGNVGINTRSGLEFSLSFDWSLYPNYYSGDMKHFELRAGYTWQYR